MERCSRLLLPSRCLITDAWFHSGGISAGESGEFQSFGCFSVIFLVLFFFFFCYIHGTDSKLFVFGISINKEKTS